MHPMWLGHFVNQLAFHYGIGGWILLALIAFALLFAALGVLLLLAKIAEGSFALGRAFGRGWRNGPTRQEDAP